jgi:hypothetical protein
MNDYTAEIERLYNEQEALKRNELEAQKQQALTQVEREQAKVMPTYTAAKQQASVQSQLGAKNLAEYWASRGQANAGITPQSEMSRQNVLAGQLGQIGQQEQQALQGFGEQRTDISTQYGSQLASELGQIGTAKSTALYNEKLRQDEMKAAQEAAQIKAQIEQEKLQQQAQQQAFENELAIRKYNLDVAKANKSGGGTKTTEQNIPGSVRTVNGQVQVWDGKKWTKATYNIDPISKQVTNIKTQTWNKKGYGLTGSTIQVNAGDKVKTYGIWVKDNQPYIIRNDTPIPYVDGLNDKLIELIGKNKGNLSTNIINKAKLTSQELAVLKSVLGG